MGIVPEGYRALALRASNHTPLILGSRLSAQAISSLTLFAAAGLILLNALLHASVYGNRNYREDEIFVVHEALVFSPPELVRFLGTFNIHPPAWRLLAQAWIRAFGSSEEITRWLSKLTNLVTFAALFQLGRQVGGRRAGLYAVALLGVYGFAANAMYELRPYAMLLMLVTALHLVFFRWLHKPSTALMFAYIFLGIAAIYTHFFSFFVFPAHAICMVLLTRYERKLWLNAFLMWVYIGLSFLGWLLPFAHSIIVFMPGGIYYSVPGRGAVIWILYDGSKLKPELVYQFLMLLSPFAPAASRRFGASNTHWRIKQDYISLYPLILLSLMILIALASDAAVRSFSLRNTVMFAPLIATCMALSLRLLPNKAALVLVALMILHAPQNIAWQSSEGPYREIVEEMTKRYQNTSIVVTEFDWAWRGLQAAAYYLMDFTPDKMSKDRMFHLIGPFDSAHGPNYSDELVNVHYQFYDAFLGSPPPEHQQLWHLREGNGNLLGDPFSAWLGRNYVLVRTESWEGEYLEDYYLSEYERAPANDGPILEVGNSLRLYVWELKGEWNVSPCQEVTIESWWQILEQDATPYTVSIILADADGNRQLAIANQIAPADRFTSDWTPERYYRDRTTIDIPCEIRSGSYDLLLAGKESLSGEPLALAYPSGEAIGREYYLTTLNVAQP